MVFTPPVLHRSLPSMYLCRFYDNTRNFKNTNFPALPIKPMQQLEKIIAIVQIWAGRISAICIVLMVVLVFYNVLMRYAFATGSIAMQELEWYFFSAAFLLGMGYVLQEDGHVRIDIFYSRFSPNGQAWVNIVGAVLFLLPFSALIAYHAMGFAEYSFGIAERSSDPGGLPFTFVIKAVIPLAFLLLFLAGIGFVLKNVLVLRGISGVAISPAHKPQEKNL